MRSTVQRGLETLRCSASVSSSLALPLLVHVARSLQWRLDQARATSQSMLDWAGGSIAEMDVYTGKLWQAVLRAADYQDK